MKKVLSIVALISVFTITFLADYINGFYHRLAVCSYVSYLDNVAEFTDNSGNTWEWELRPADHFGVGKAYILHMHDNLSDTIYDDYIVEISE